MITVISKAAYIVLCSLTVILLLSCSSQEHSEIQLSRRNDYPIILVHGLIGWGKDELLGFHYWGGFEDIETYLNRNGHVTYTASVGPVSSNWDRAVELYYYIKGGTVDYGKAHASKHGHIRYGKTYSGLYPEWDEEHPVHLVGHSMGGLTIRALTDLLIDGDEAERELVTSNAQKEDLSPLYEGDKQWVHSVTTIGTPHNGSTFADDENRMAEIIKNAVRYIALLAEADDSSSIYDFKLEQWNISKAEDESFDDYMNRVLNNPFWSSADISVGDLNTNGAAYNNVWMDTHSTVYYFSQTGQTTTKSSWNDYHLPLRETNPIMLSPAIFIGSFTRNDSAKGIVIDESWWPNDGLVSTISSKHPTGHPARAYEKASSITKGVWYYFPTKIGWDHMDLIGLNATTSATVDKTTSFYSSIAELLHSLPK